MLSGIADDFEQCYRAAQAKDSRFDGWFFIGVTSTGIYCRPACPAQTPKRANVCFYPTAAAAQQAGFRACKRCRPDATPGSPEWNARADVVARAMRLIADGLVDREGVPGLASELGYSVRQLQRVLLAEVGAGPLALARAQRAQAARILIETTALAMADVAFASGFSSVRQFNDTVRAVFAVAPTELRTRALARRGSGGAGRSEGRRSALSPNSHLVSLRLPFRQPLSPGTLFGHLAANAVPGVEEVRDGTYRRTLRLAHGPAVAELRPTPDHIDTRLHLSDLRDLASAIARCRWLLDLDADPVAVDEVLSDDPALAPLIAKEPGRRVLRCVDGSELAVRAVLGQRVSTVAARSAAGRLAADHGEPIEDPGGGLTHLFPEPGTLVDAELPGTATRRGALHAVAGALASGELDLGLGTDRECALATLGSLPGIGPWTEQVVAMRALGEPDAFPAGDLGLRQAAEALDLPTAPAALTARAERWRPWRAYAAKYLWSTLDHPINDWPPVAASRRNPL